MHQVRSSRIGLIATPFAAVLLVLAAAPWVARAAGPTPTPATPAGMTMEAHALVQGHARTGSWMAIRVDLANDGPSFVGELRIVGGTQGRTRFALPVDLPTTSRKAYILHAQAPAFGSSLEVALVANETVVTGRVVAFALHDPGQLVIGVVAERPGPLVAALGRLRDPAGPQPAVVQLAVADLPERPEAWSAIDRLVWQDVDAGQLSADQLAALRTWLAGGGRLTIVGGSGGLGLLGGFPDELLPFRPTVTIDVDPEAVRGLLGGTLPRGAEALPALAGSPAAGARALAGSGDRAIVGDRPFGSGAVTLAGFDPSTPWLAESTSVDVLWASLVPARGTARTPLIVGDDGILVSLLATMPALALPSIGGLLLLLLGYILLIGPVNYLVLRRLDRREWAWVTMPVLVVGFTVAAFAIGFVLRGTDVIVNQIALVRAAPGTDAAQAQVYLGVFSPTRGSYEVGVPGGALLSAPYSGEGFGQGGGGGLDVVQGDPARLRQLAVGYGTLRAVRAEAPVLAPRIEADLRLEGDRVRGTIRNASAVPLAKPAVVLGSAVVVLPDLAPGASATVDLRAQPDDFGRALSERIFGQQSFSSHGNPGSDFLRDQVRRQLVDALTYDPFFGSNGTLPSDGPVLLAWGRPGVFAVTVAGEEPRTAGETLYFLPLGLAASGPVTFAPDLMRSSLIEVKAQFFNKDPFNLTIGGGSVTLAYRPIAVSGRLVPTRLALGVNMGFPAKIMGGGVNPGSGVEPAPPTSEPAATPTPSGASGTGAPDEPVKPPPGVGDASLPRLELFDRDAGAWREVQGLASGMVVEIRGPGRFVDPASGTILVRLSNDRQDAVNLQLALQLEGTME
ncbi:MAG: hypothetical protein V2B17_00010 [Chloroflexota bacterium]